jgi:hypothetical protein
MGSWGGRPVARPAAPKRRAPMTSIVSDTEADSCREYVLPEIYAGGWAE